MHTNTLASSIVALSIVVLVFAAVGPRGKPTLMVSCASFIALMTTMWILPSFWTQSAVGAVTHMDQSRDKVHAVGAVTHTDQSRDEVRGVGAVTHTDQSRDEVHAVGAVTHMDQSRDEVRGVGAVTYVNQMLDHVDDVDASAGIWLESDVDDSIGVNTTLESNVDSGVDMLAKDEPLTSEELDRRLQLVMQRGVCTQFVPGVSEPSDTYKALIHNATQTQFNMATLRSSQREPDPTEMYYRREQLAIALAQDLILYNRSQNGRLKDTHLKAISTTEAAASMTAG
jgi:hypothetical protein